MATFTLLDQAEEDKLHATRLLSVEEKPFKRLTRRLLSKDSPIQSFSSRLPTPPPDDAPESTESGDESRTANRISSRENYLQQLARVKSDTLLDFAAFSSSIARIQFLRAANASERQRYNDEKQEILQTAQEVRENTAQLRVQLDEAQRTLAIRKEYDILAERVMSDERLKKPRSELGISIERLKVEIEDLEREGRELEGSWGDRREAWGRVVGDAGRVRRLVRGEVVDPTEEDGNYDEGVENAMEGRGGGDHDDREGEDTMGDTLRGEDGGMTPRPDVEDASTPGADDSGSMTPAIVREATPPLTGTEVDSAMADEEAVAASEPARSKLNIVVTAEEDQPADQMDTT